MQKNQAITIDIIQLESSLNEMNTPNELSLVYLLKGKCHFLNQEQQLSLHKKDFIFIGPNQKGQLISDSYNKEVIILRLIFHLPEIESLINQNWRPVFPSSKIDVYQSNGREKLIESIFRLTLERLTKASKDRSFSDLLLVSDLLDKVEGMFLFTQYQELASLDKQKIHPLIIDMLDYAKVNYTTKLSLGDFAKEKFVSEADLSKLFKNEMGVTFSDYLSSIRLKAAVSELRNSTEPTLSIALNNGFPNPKSFTAVFKKQYGVTPHEYRKHYIPKQEVLTLQQTSEDYRYLSHQESIQVIAQFMLTQNIKQAKGLSVEEIELDLSIPPFANLNKPQKIINLGHANNGLKESVRQQVRMIQEKIPFDICRFYDFCTETISEFDIIKDRFVNNHRLFSFMREMNLRPMFVLVIDESNGISELSLKLDTLKEMIQGYVQYEASFREGWYLELSISDSAKVSQTFFRQAYQLTSDFLVTHFSTGYLGFNLNFNYLNDWLTCLRLPLNVDPDFISITYEKSLGLQSQSEHLFKGFKRQISQLKHYLKNIEKNTALYISEWHLVAESTQLSQSTFSRSAILLKALIEMTNHIDGIGFWLNVDSEKSIPISKKLGDLSIFLHGPLKRPLFFLLVFYDRIGDEVVLISEHYIVTKKFNSFYVLYYNEHHLDKKDSAYENLWKATRQQTTFLFNQLPVGNYLVKRFLLDSHHGGIYHQWLKSGGMRELDTDMQEYLQQSVVPEFLMKELSITDGKLEESIDLEMNACYLIILNRIN